MIFQAARILSLTTISFLAALLITPFVVQLLKKIHANKQIRNVPVFYNLHKHKENTLTMGGIIIWATVFGIAAVVALLAWIFDGFWGYLNFIDRAETYLPLAAMFLAAAFGLFDDIMGALRIGANGGGLKVSQKLILYAIIAAIGGWWFYFKLGFNTLYVPFYGNVEIGWWYIPIFMFIMIASAFSANETDGLDGLLGGVSLFSFGALVIVAFALGKYHIAAFCGTLIGALLAFLWFNIYPAKFFMGDTGSMALGITMGVVALLTNTALFLPFFAFIPLIESLSVIIQVISRKFFGRRVFALAPLHHHFESIGWPETEVTMRFWIISAVISALGLILFFISRFLL
ncbi:MAG: phospho-N-acetylmuramoyl-pentapeptide-transferase [Candidatus Pacebacteria bacterium]|nr:phospho-N-acetylmuramoyl-pentapeptide-transferase [Candidatus Paceibacterota bacterium]